MTLYNIPITSARIQVISRFSQALQKVHVPHAQVPCGYAELYVDVTTPKRDVSFTLCLPLCHEKARQCLVDKS